MRHTLLFCAIIFVPSYQKKSPDVTLSVHQRVGLLKRQIEEQLRHHTDSDLIQPIDLDRDYVYVENDSPVTPIMDFDERKKDGKFNLKQIKTTTTDEDVKVTPVPVERSNIEMRENGFEKSKVVKSKRRKHRPAMVEPLDSFYRRLLDNMETPVEWIHCQDLITPFFIGYKEDLSVAKRLTHTDHNVRRFLQLIRLNTTTYTKDEIYSILYQISNIQLRLFQWDYTAITLLINSLAKDQPHNFRTVQAGVIQLLSRWHLDISNTTDLLKQTRIFRPPCVRVSEYEGSTKTSRGIRFTKSTTPKSTCSIPGIDCP